MFDSNKKGLFGSVDIGGGGDIYIYIYTHIFICKPNTYCNTAKCPDMYIHIYVHTYAYSICTYIYIDEQIYIYKVRVQALQSEAGNAAATGLLADEPLHSASASVEDCFR